MGRFAQADTIVPGAGNPLAWDRYAYTLNNPLKYTDPTGHLVCSEVSWEEDCEMTEGQEDLILARREQHQLTYFGKTIFKFYEWMATHDGWWNEDDNDFTFEDFMGLAILNEMGTEDNALGDMIDAATNQLWMDGRKGGGHDAYCKTSPCYAGALNFVNQSESFWRRWHVWKEDNETWSKPNRFGSFDEYAIGSSILTRDSSRIAYNPNATYNWGNDPNWAAAIDAAVNANPNDPILGHAPNQIVYYNPVGAFMVFTINQDVYWR